MTKTKNHTPTMTILNNIQKHSSQSSLHQTNTHPNRNTHVEEDIMIAEDQHQGGTVEEDEVEDGVLNQIEVQDLIDHAPTGDQLLSHQERIKNNALYAKCLVMDLMKMIVGFSQEYYALLSGSRITLANALVS